MSVTQSPPSVARRIAEIASSHGAKAFLSQGSSTVIAEFKHIKFTAMAEPDRIIVSWYGDQRRLNPQFFDRVNGEHGRRAESRYSSFQALEERLPSLCEAAQNGSAIMA